MAAGVIAAVITIGVGYNFFVIKVVVVSFYFSSGSKILLPPPKLILYNKKDPKLDYFLTSSFATYAFYMDLFRFT